MVISGGARSVDSWAEQGWLALGGEVLSYRVRELGLERFAVEEWHLGIPQPTLRVVIEYPTAADYVSALFFRTFAVLDLGRPDRVVAFYPEHGAWTSQRGTEFTVELASNEVNRIPTYILRKGETEWESVTS